MDTLRHGCEPDIQDVTATRNRTGKDCPGDTCIHQLFEDQTRRDPSAIACSFEGRSISYAQLNARANRIAHRLRTLGVQPDSRVAICMRRSPDMLVALLSILKAGGAYVPLDPAYPLGRLRFMLLDCRPVAVLGDGSTREALEQAFVETPAPPILDLSVDESGGYPERDPDIGEIGLKSSNLAYVIYTSGSTGVPKGVMVEHRNVVNYLLWAAAYYCLGPGSCAPVNTSFAFDATVTSLVAPLVSGGQVDLLPDGDQELSALAEVLAAGRGYALVKLTPSHLQALQLLRPSAGRSEAARAFVIGGESLAAHQIAFWREKAPGIRLINEYGPTEATVGMIVYEVTADTSQLGPVPIGRPIWNTRIYLLDEQRRLVPDGVAGEIYIGGAGVARGYLNRPELTAQQFIESPFVQGDRLYRTGDLARLLPDGNVLFLGRIDDQIKIDGFRIEPAEIEAAIKTHSAVAEAVALVCEDSSGDRRLVAYLAPAAASEKLDEIREMLKTLLPAHMVPNVFAFVDAFPLTVNGKLDRAALPPPAEGQARESCADEISPATPFQRELTRIWCEVLKKSHVGISDNFFQTGGNSLLAARVVSRVRSAFRVELKMAAIFRTPTIAELAEQIEGLVWARGASGRKPAQADDTFLEGHI